MGILTNYKEWIFTKYTMSIEFDHQMNEDYKHTITYSPFMQSQAFTIMDDKF